MLEQLLEFIEDTEGKHLQVVDKNGEPVFSHNVKNNSELREIFETEYKTLKPGFTGSGWRIQKPAPEAG